MAAISVTQYVRDILTELRPRLTRNADRARLGEAIAQVTKALGPALYLDEGHLTRKNGRKVFRFDQDAVRTLRGLLGRLGFTESLPPNPDTIPQCRSNVPTDGVINPLYGCAQLLFGIDREVAGRAVDDYALSTGFSTTLTWATARLTEGDEDWNAGEIEAIDDYSEAWELVTR